VIDLTVTLTPRQVFLTTPLSPNGLSFALGVIPFLAFQR